MVWLSDGEKKIEDKITRFDRMHERDRRTDGWTYTQTDTQTPHDGIASRGKNQHQMLYGTLNDPDYITAL